MRNNFDGLRLLSALAVVVGHAYVLTGFARAPRVWDIPIHTLGVCVFFAISGYLVTGSWQNHPSVLRYLTARVRRIFPGLIVVVILSTFILGPLASTLRPGEYFAKGETWSYLLNVTLFASYDLPGVFETNLHSSAVNGSLWTLGLEFLCYFVVLAVGIALRRMPSAGFLLFGLVSGFASFLPRESALGSWLGPIGELFVFFAVGALLRLRIPASAYSLRRAALVAVVWTLLSLALPALVMPLAWLALPYCVVAVGTASTPVLRDVSRMGDASYGTYLWGYPIQQLILALWGPLPFAANLAIVVTITLSLAFASWHLVEKRAIASRRILVSGSMASDAQRKSRLDRAERSVW